jgi:hypothetical protein
VQARIVSSDHGSWQEGLPTMHAKRHLLVAIPAFVFGALGLPLAAEASTTSGETAVFVAAGKPCRGQCRVGFRQGYRDGYKDCQGTANPLGSEWAPAGQWGRGYVLGYQMGINDCY